jgi:uncharacterized protein (TIGR03067 family)
MFLIGLGFAGDGLNTGLAAPGDPEPREAVASPVEGNWELSEFDNGGRTIGYHPQVKVTPGYAVQMFAYTAKNPEKGSDVKGMRWHFARERLAVDWVVEEDKKESRYRLGDFTCRFDARAKPATIDLTWQPPGLEGLVREEKGQVVPGIYKRDGDKLEVLLSHTDKDRPREFKVDRSSYRLVFRKQKG